MRPAAASAEGLKPASVEIVSRPSAAAGGLSREMPAEGLPAYLGRGPTPAGPSFVVTRRPATVAGTAAGANADNASASFDDNEMTEWLTLAHRRVLAAAAAKTGVAT